MRQVYPIGSNAVYLNNCIWAADAGPLVGSALLKLVKNVTEPTVLKYCLARMEELLPGTGGAERF